MKLPSPKTLIAVMSFAAVISVAVVDFGRTAPGQILAAHARIDGLADASSCSQCHGGWTSSMTNSCLECHDVIQAHMDGGIGLHGTIEGELAANCASCHSEHHGLAFQAVNELSFARAGVEDPAVFEHSRIGFDMLGAHLELECAECHTHAHDDVVPEGEHRYIGLTQACATCHDDVHEGAYQATCVVCHVQSSFEEPHYVGHGQFLELVGAHADITCAECHEDGTEHSLSVLRGPAALRPVYRSCVECHTSPHADSFISESAALAGVERALRQRGPRTNVLCTSCHEVDHLAFHQDAASMTPAQHAATGFLLALPHDATTCAECHDPEAPYAERYPGRSAEACAVCHDDPHAGQFEGLEFAAFLAANAPRDAAVQDPDRAGGGAVEERGCLVCHARTHFEPHLFDQNAHANTDLPLDGAHLEVECAECHAPAGGESHRVFHGVAHQCDACHGDAHGGFFDEVLAENLPVPEHGDCARCHSTAAFSPSTAEPFDHTFWTGYELTGSHAIAECTSCHAQADAPDGDARSFGRIGDIYGAVEGCASCHDDVHAGRFDGRVNGRRLKAAIDGRRDCARCHTTASFRDLPHGFDHGKWTGWRLDDTHAAADCTACHAPLRRPLANGRTWAEANGTGCVDCHQSPHGDQFDAPRAKSCSKCHESARAFGVLSFDHDLESRFPLDEAHEAVKCSGCHKPDETTDIVQYRPLSMECVDCHGVHEKALRRRRRNR